MHSNNYKTLIWFSFFLFISTYLHSQESSSEFEYEIELLNRINKVYGSDDLIYNGPNFHQSHIGAKGYPYFATSNWAKGIIYFKEHVYENIPLKYNLEINEIVLQVEKVTGAIEEIILNSSFVDSFRIGNNIFLNSIIIESTDSLNLGYLEILYQSDIVLLKKHKKIFSSVYNENSPLGKYTTYNPVFYIFSNSGISKIANKSSFLNYFDEHRKEIKKFMKKNKIKLKEASNYKLYSLMHFCNDISSK